MAGTRISSHWWQELEAPHTKQVAGCFVLLKQVAGTRISSHWWQELEAPHTKQVAGWTARLVSCKRGSWCPISSLLRLLLSRKRWRTQRPWPESSVRSRWTSFFFATRRSWNHKLNPCFFGVLVPADVTPELINQALEHVVKFRKNQRERLWEQANVQKRTSGKTVSRLISTTCLCDESG